MLQPDDVVLVGPVGPQVALIGSVNQPAIFELRSGETVADLLRMAGGFSALADRSRSLDGTPGRPRHRRVRELAMPQDARPHCWRTATCCVHSAQSRRRCLPSGRTRRVRIEGEVLKPGDYVLPPMSSLSDALRAAGGLTPQPMSIGAEFSRESVRSEAAGKLRPRAA
jgi:protein involved in polysaccharide export with SLBB domain